VAPFVAHRVFITCVQVTRLHNAHLCFMVLRWLS